MFSITWISAQTLDVDYPNSNCPASRIIFEGGPVGQSFTANISGDLTTVKVGIFTNNSCTVTTTMNCLATLYSGPCMGGTVLTTQNFSIPTSQPLSMYPINFTNPASISSGQTYTLELSVDPGQTCTSGSVTIPLRLRWSWNGGLCGVGYAGGAAYIPTCVPVSFDFYIQTYVTTGVPGCTDVTACNYNASATVSNGSCTYASTFYIYTDGDGYGAGTATNACAQPSGYVAANIDCNNTNAAVNPAATEICNSIDDNCDGLIDEGLTFTNYYADTDGDGYGAGTATNACAQPAGYVTNSSDCNNSNAAVNPAATEICNSIDDDCDTQIDEGVQINYYADTDGDGYGAGTATLACTAPTGFVTTSTDCNNTNPAVNPAAMEICNSIDDDCDTQIDEGLTFTNYYADADGDGFGAGTATNACAQPTGYVTNSSDCNNSNSAVNPAATEICNSIDDDCDTQIDEGLTFTNYYADTDGDGFGAGAATNACAQPTGYVINNTDCNDTNAAISPTTLWYLNADGDGYYVSTIVSCTSPGANYNTTGGTAGDCNDTNAAVNDGATEICNGIDDDCDAKIDENSSNTY